MTTPIRATTWPSGPKLIADVAHQIRQHAGRDDTQPVWAPSGTHLDVELIGKGAVWRAANGIDPQDCRPAGPAQLQTPPGLWQLGRDRQVQHLSDETFDYGIQEARAASRTIRGLRPEDRHHSPQPYEGQRRSLPPGTSL
jgi:hypothetical protein